LEAPDSIFQIGNLFSDEMVKAQFWFCFVNNIPAGKAKRKRSLIQTFCEASAAHFFDWLAFASVACFFSMQIFSYVGKLQTRGLKK